MRQRSNNLEIFNKATEILRSLYGSMATFRDGQYEAIEATMTQNRTLVVQRTGWGKSLVYFICTKLMREQKRGVTMVVSPLLVLMENQIEAAETMGLQCDVLNSTTRDRRSEILRALEQDELDLILVTPETLFSDEVQEKLKNIRIGLFVIDEAHCISDWGHDFRLEYGRLKTIIQQIPGTVPILATTATANDRVVADLQAQLGDRVFVSRGPLTRDSLYLQILNKPGKIERYAWILETLPKLPGSGIIYCLTQRDCDYLADFLKQNGIAAEAYYSRSTKEGEELNCEVEERFRKNQLKVIVATIKLGMGYDKHSTDKKIAQEIKGFYRLTGGCIILDAYVDDAFRGERLYKKLGVGICFPHPDTYFAVLVDQKEDCLLTRSMRSMNYSDMTDVWIPEKFPYVAFSESGYKFSHISLWGFYRHIQLFTGCKLGSTISQLFLKTGVSTDTLKNLFDIDQSIYYQTKVTKAVWK